MVLHHDHIYTRQTKISGTENVASWLNQAKSNSEGNIAIQTLWQASPDKSHD